MSAADRHSWQSWTGEAFLPLRTLLSLHLPLSAPGDPERHFFSCEGQCCLPGLHSTVAWEVISKPLKFYSQALPPLPGHSTDICGMNKWWNSAIVRL